MRAVEADGELTISQVAERTGVPVATIKFYIRQGLLPRPRTRGRTVGRYDVTFVGRLETIRELRNRHRLSLREIGALLSEIGPCATRTEVELRLLGKHRLDAAIDPTHALPKVSAEKLRERAGLSNGDIEQLQRHGLLTPLEEQGTTVYAEHDARIAEVVGALRLSGYSERLGFSIADLTRYVEAIRGIVVQEVEQFDRPALRQLPRAEVVLLVEQRVAHIDILIGLLHKKLLLAAVHDLMDARCPGRGRD